MTKHRPELQPSPAVNEFRVDDRRTGFLEEILPDQWSIPYVALLVYTFAIVTERFPVGTPAVVVGLVSLLFSKQRLRFAPPLNWMAIFLLWSCVGYFFSDYPSVVSDELYAYFKLVLIAFLVVNAIRTRNQAQFFLIFVLAWYFYYPIRVALMNFFLLDYTVFGRAIASGIYGNPNDLATLTLIQISVAIAIFSGLKQRWARWAAIGVTLIMAVVIVLTQSRGAFLGGLAFLALIVGSERKKLRIFLGLVAALGLIIILVPASTFDRFERFTSVISSGSSISSADEEGSAAARSDIYRLGLMISADHPVAGVGLGSYPLANEQYARKAGIVGTSGGGQVDAHSTYLSTLAETGIPGLLIILLLFGTTLRSVSRTRRSLFETDPRTAKQLGILVAGYIGFLVAAVVGTYTQLAMTYVHLCAIWVFAESVRGPIGGDGSVRKGTIAKSKVKKLNKKTVHD